MQCIFFQSLPATIVGPTVARKLRTYESRLQLALTFIAERLPRHFSTRARRADVANTASSRACTVVLEEPARGATDPRHLRKHFFPIGLLATGLLLLRELLDFLDHLDFLLLAGLWGQPDYYKCWETNPLPPHSQRIAHQPPTLIRPVVAAGEVMLQPSTDRLLLSSWLYFGNRPTAFSHCVFSSNLFDHRLFKLA